MAHQQIEMILATHGEIMWPQNFVQRMDDKY